jgi:predicted metal-binding transcription factor (methanogenesis marker protein 9)
MEAKGSSLAQISDDEYYQLKTDFSNFTTRTSELDTDLTERTRMAVAFISQYTARDILVGIYS